MLAIISLVNAPLATSLRRLVHTPIAISIDTPLMEMLVLYQPDLTRTVPRDLYWTACGLNTAKLSRRNPGVVCMIHACMRIVSFQRADCRASCMTTGKDFFYFAANFAAVVPADVSGDSGLPSVCAST